MYFHALRQIYVGMQKLVNYAVAEIVDGWIVCVGWVKPGCSLILQAAKDGE